MFLVTSTVTYMSKKFRIYFMHLTEQKWVWSSDIVFLFFYVFFTIQFLTHTHHIACTIEFLSVCNTFSFCFKLVQEAWILLNFYPYLELNFWKINLIVDCCCFVWAVILSKYNFFHSMSITHLLVSFNKEKIMASILVFECDGHLTVMYLYLL
jgi:hypothetical protein